MTASMQHLDDGALVRLLDQQPLAGDDPAHVDHCARCQSRYETLAAASEMIRKRLDLMSDAAPVPPSDLWQRATRAAAARGAAAKRPRAAWRLRERPLARAALFAILLLAGALAAQPVRTWISDRVTSLFHDPAGQIPSPDSRVREQGLAVSASFVPEGDKVIIRLDAAQEHGSLVVRFEDRDDVRAEVLADAQSPATIVLPDGFHIANAGAEGWSYRIAAPARVRVVEVRIGDRVVAEVRPGAGAEVTVDLRG